MNSAPASRTRSAPTEFFSASVSVTTEVSPGCRSASCARLNSAPESRTGSVPTDSFSAPTSVTTEVSPGCRSASCARLNSPPESRMRSAPAALDIAGVSESACANSPLRPRAGFLSPRQRCKRPQCLASPPVTGAFPFLRIGEVVLIAIHTDIAWRKTVRKRVVLQQRCHRG